MSAYMLLCNFTDQGVRAIKDVPKRRAAAQELGKKFGVDIKAVSRLLGRQRRQTVPVVRLAL